MSIYDIIAACPDWGITDSAEKTIDQAFERLIKETADSKLQGFYCGIYSAYVSLTIGGCGWDDIKFMLKAASDWSIDDLNMYMEGRAYALPH